MWGDLHINYPVLFNTDNDTSITCDRQSACLGESVTCASATGNSNRLAWILSSGSRLEFAAGDPLQTRRNVSGSSTTAVLTGSFNTNGVRTITSNITLIASTLETILLTCENVDGSTINALLIPVSGKWLMNAV
jgi:hypothetical protein